MRVDIRGCGDSDGILMGEYLAQEQDDALEVLEWIAAQPWSDGGAGMIGLSWTGFNGLQVAYRRPPQLKAVISCCSTDDRYGNDIHYMGGCVLGIDMLSWATTMLGYNARPPQPDVVGEAWRESWMRRIDETPPFVEDWLAHQRRDAFWKHGSISESYGTIECPLLMVGGWADAYRSTVLRVLEGYDGPCKGLIGPWSHHYGFNGLPGPVDRLPPGGAALVGSLAQGRRDRRDRRARACVPGCRSRCAPTPTRPPTARAAGSPSPSGPRATARRRRSR